MKIKRPTRCLVWMVISTMLAAAFGALSIHSQQNSSQEQDRKGHEEFKKYPVVNFDEPEPTDPEEREKRKLKNKRYDNWHFVKGNPHPETSGVSRKDERPPPPAIPVAESDLIAIGKITEAKAFLSNDKSGIYSEYAFLVSEIIKGDGSKRVATGKIIIVDRAGGTVQYAKGQKVVYFVSGGNLPRVESEYVLFLRDDKKSPNYEIVTGYELVDGKIYSLDKRRHSNEFRDVIIPNFIGTIRSKIQKPD